MSERTEDIPDAASDAGHRGYRPVPIPPNTERDKRVAARRAADAARAGAALDRLLAERPSPLRDQELYSTGYWDGYAASQLHHNGHYDVSLPTGGEMVGYAGEPLCPCGCGCGRDARHPA
jgi:hypothetical protein